MRLARALGLSVLAWGLLVGTAAADTTTHSPVADSYVNAASPGANYGTQNRLRVDGSPTVTSYLRFDLSALSGQVQSATLRIYPTSSATNGIAVHGVSNNTWPETGLTYSNAPATGPAAVTSGRVTSDTPISLDVTSLVNAGGLVSLALSTPGSTAIALGSREDPVRTPVLTVDTASVGTQPTASLVADTYVAEASPNATNGTSTRLRVDGSPLVRSYLRFNITGITGSVQSATLRLHPTSSGRDGFRIHPVSNTTWPETTTNWTNAPAIGAAAASSGAVTAEAPVSINITSLVPGNGMLSLAVTTPGSTAISLGSREDSAREPKLIIQATTAPPDDDPLIAAAGDIACSPSSSAFNGGLGTATQCRQMYTSDVLLAHPFDAVLPLGDLQYETGDLADFQASYDPSWGRVKPITKPVPGNHEYTTAGASGYYDYFNGAGNATGIAGDRTRGYYSYDLGSWHLIALNSNCGQVACAAGSAQEQWLRADLAAHPATCTLAYWHHPRFSSGVHGSLPQTADFWTALDQAGADVVVVGHDHDYERFAPQDPNGVADPQGIREFVVGTGGRNHRAFETTTPIAPNSEFRDATNFGVLSLALHSTGYDWQYLSEAGSSLQDSGSASCN
jgi:hypothetical protein